MDEQGAKRIAQAELDRWNGRLTPNRLKDPHATTHDPDDEVVITHVEPRPRAYVVYYATRRWVRTRSISDQLAGTSPFVVERATGTLHKYGSSPDEHAKFAAWLDD